MMVHEGLLFYIPTWENVDAPYAKTKVEFKRNHELGDRFDRRGSGAA